MVGKSTHTSLTLKGDSSCTTFLSLLFDRCVTCRLALCSVPTGYRYNGPRSITGNLWLSSVLLLETKQIFWPAGKHVLKSLAVWYEHEMSHQAAGVMRTQWKKGQTEHHVSQPILFISSWYNWGIIVKDRYKSNKLKSLLWIRDLGSDAFMTPGSGIRDGEKIKIWIRD